MTSLNQNIDVCDGVSLSGISAASITTLAFSTNSQTVNSVATATITFSIINAMLATDYIYLNFPNDFTFSSGTK